MKKLIPVLVTIIILAFLVDFGFAGLPRYEITALHAVGGGVPYAISDIGSVAGGFFTGYADRAFLWNSTDGMVDIALS